MILERENCNNVHQYVGNYGTLQNMEHDGLVAKFVPLVCEMSAIVRYAIEHSLALPFFGIGIKTDLFHESKFFYIGMHIAYRFLGPQKFQDHLEFL